MSRLDRDRPCGEVFGMPGVKFEQDGRYYDHNGHEFGVPYEEPAPEPATVADIDDPAVRSSRHLQAMMRQYGEEWTTREAAVAFLRGRG